MITKLFIITLLFCVVNVAGKSQGIQLGFDITPSFQFQLKRNDVTKIRSSVSGNGFSTGLNVRKHIKDYTTINSGLKLEYIAFNQKSGSFIVSGYRILGVHLPLIITQNIGLSENWFYSAGGGLNYNFSNRNFLLGQWVSINGIVNRVQPNLALGLNYSPGSGSNFEIEALVRYALIDNYISEQQMLSQSNTHLASFDFSIKYFVNSSNEN